MTQSLAHALGLEKAIYIYHRIEQFVMYPADNIHWENVGTFNDTPDNGYTEAHKALLELKKTRTNSFRIIKVIEEIVYK